MKKGIFTSISLVVLSSILVACSTLNDTPTDTGNNNLPVSTLENTYFNEIVAVDNENCLIKLTGMDDDNVLGFTLNAYLENKSPDTTYMFSVKDSSVNGVQCDPFFATEVLSGKKANENIYFSDSTLKENGIEQYTDIEITFCVYNSADFSSAPVAEETVHVYPYGEDKASEFVRENQPTDNTIIDNEYATVIVTGYKEDDILGYTANLFLVNKTDKELMFSVDECSLNGYMADPLFASSVNGGKSRFCSLSWSNDILANNKITTVDEISFTFKIYDPQNFIDGQFVNETITLKPQEVQSN